MKILIEDEKKIVLEEQKQEENVDCEEPRETNLDVSFYLRLRK